MAIIAQGSCEIAIDASGGSQVDIHAQSTQCTLSMSNQVSQQATFGDVVVTNYEGLRSYSASVTIEVTDNIAEGEASDILGDWVVPSSGKPGARTLSVSYPDDSTAGSITYSGEAYLTGTPLVQGVAGSGTPQTLTANMALDSITKTDVT